jgi:hypothetical protein
MENPTSTMRYPIPQKAKDVSDFLMSIYVVGTARDNLIVVRLVVWTNCSRLLNTSKLGEFYYCKLLEKEECFQLLISMSFYMMKTS